MIPWIKRHERRNKLSINSCIKKTDNGVMMLHKVRSQGEELLEIQGKKQTEERKILNKIIRKYCTKEAKLQKRKEQQIIQAIPRDLMEARDWNKRHYGFDLGKFMETSISGRKGKQQIMQVYSEEDYY